MDLTKISMRCRFLKKGKSFQNAPMEKIRAETPGLPAAGPWDIVVRMIVISAKK
jgi:hypothetical protein